jgi:hypothetical protein
MNIFVDGSSLLKHLSEFQNITDEEIEKRATSEYGGLDAEYCLMLYLERDFVQGWNKEIIKELKKIC